MNAAKRRAARGDFAPVSVERNRLRAAVVIASLMLLTTQCGPPMPNWALKPARAPERGTTIVVVGDTQRTSFPEWFFLNREQNEAARRKLVQQIAEKERPAFVVHLGDLVAEGGDRTEWEYFDRLMSPLTVRDIPIVPALGNHDYWGDESVALREAGDRFPELGRRTFYSMRYQGLGLIWLNTNLGGDAAHVQ